MQLYRRSILALTLVLTTSVAAAAQGTVKGVTMKPAEAAAGTAVTATATGSSPCGAVHIDWGDGEAITYATETLPYTQSHVYKTGGTFNVRAQGMGNCDGEARARVTITAPPPPPPVPSRISGIQFAPAVQKPKAPVTITLQGTGSCRATVNFGDGNSQEVSGPLPLSIRHTYALADEYMVVAIPAPPCGGARVVAALTIGDRPAVARITGLDVSRVRNGAGLRAIRVNGTGQCGYAIDYGDGNNETRTAALPDVVRHNYPAEGQYTIRVTGAAPCAGSARSIVVIRFDRSR